MLTRTDYAAIAFQAFVTLAPGLVPADYDRKQIDGLAGELWQQDTARKGFTLATHPDYASGELIFPALQAVDYFGRPIADIWIEFCGTPSAFFYWEA